MQEETYFKTRCKALTYLIDVINFFKPVALLFIAMATIGQVYRFK
ncbi:MAG: hypothetical protein AAF518_24630 [Spirochaetota bacterium]